MRKIYISGPITGTEGYMERFAEAEEYLRKETPYIPINPAAVCGGMPPETEYEEYMKIGMTLLEMCDGIYMLNGWEKSCGANREYGYAVGMDLFILEERKQESG